MILTDKSKNSKEYGTAWRDFLSAMLTFNSERRKNGSLSDIIEGGLDVFLHFPGADFAALFLLDQETSEFRYSTSVPAKESKTVNDLFLLLVEEQGVAESLESGNAVLWNLKNGEYKDSPVLIAPVICAMGVLGVVILICKTNEIELEQLIMGLCKLHASQFATMLYNARLNKKVNSIQNALEQKIVFRTKKIEQSERELKSVIDSVQTGIMIIDKETNLVLDANLAAQHIIGAAKEELIGSKRRDVCLLPEYSDPFNKGSKTKLRNLECVIKREDGMMTPILRTVSNVTLGNRNCYLVSFMDITEQKFAENAIKESERHFRTIFEKAGTGMVLTDLNDRIVEANKAFCDMIGYSEGELKLLTFADLTFPEDIGNKTAAKYADRQNENSGPQLQTQKRYIHKSGRIVWGKLTSTFIHHANGERKLGLNMVEDITEQKISEEALIKAKEAAEEASRIKSSLMANMSHELRTPMNGILGFSQILNIELVDPFMKEMNMKILTSGKRLMNTINSILDLSMFESSAPKVTISDYNLLDLFCSLSPLYENLAAEKKLKFNINAEDKNISVYADRRLFEQIVNNLLDNAIKYTEKGEITVTITSYEDDETIWGVISVKDTGIGIAKDYFDFIYDAFRQVSEGIGRKYEGAGLGLTLVKKMVQILGGTISLESELGVGSVFTVRLPGKKTKQGIEIGGLPETAETTDGQQKKPKVLIVEDNSINQDVAAIFLHDICEVVQTEDGETAVKKAAADKYDAVLMDINLGPGITGIEAAKRIRRLPGYENTPIIAITGYAMAGDKERLLNEGLTHYLPKPFDKEQIINILEEALS